jgi:ferritin-like metal-binding protein YciE
MRKDEILIDAEYALAKATKLAGAKKTSEIMENTIKEENKIDAELEKLKEKLNETVE